ncbi:2-(1,2-epoxy-1,2-dihydrophenyl)acetyl-CoA isomerase [Ktedonosporobacter rubrisoli]|uniref:2-(1,2-epoxy-1,2-dihydrophenyl)acetyl-CoA isomerase n=1 Tax=Ktedonosporobacter rubrisoli TaxID=2509675 RepID=A0A4P6K164_KTERU|nr:enoyl-CoA hydratase-related protein [Ktedonosporobacter rubrisoli]QBD81938.1 2-(1,2-epoxy-1,2-dihydrophenyl)acetyl-CoA isomerase [Ktedonosporobacter rubrisoli]
MRSNFQHLLLRQEEGVVVITMNRPEVLNAFNDAMLQELTEAVEEAAKSDDVRCLVLTGAGRAFGSGQDLSAFASAQHNAEAQPVSEHLKKYHRLLSLIREMPKPVIAAIRGVAAGISCNVALSCDLRIAADNARFIEAFARIGLVPDGGGGYFLPRLIGLGKALEMAMLTDEVSGPEAERIGLVNKCVPLAEFETETMALAKRLAQGPTRTYGLIKQLMYQSLDCDLPSALELEGRLQDAAKATADHREGVNAFLQKRRPHYSGK